MYVKECELACDTLGIPLSGKIFKDGKPCFRGGNGVCNQNGGHGGRSNMICKHTGRHCRYIHTHICRYILALAIQTKLQQSPFQKSMVAGQNGVNGVLAQPLVEEVIKCVLGPATSQYLPTVVPIVRTTNRPDLSVKKTKNVERALAPQVN